MEKEALLQTLKHISDSYFQKKDYISAGMINRAMDVVNDYDGVLLQANVIKLVCADCGDEFDLPKLCMSCENNKGLPM